MTNTMRVSSPLTAGPVDKVGVIQVRELVAAYASGHSFDVSVYLPPTQDIELYRCRDTGLGFFRPDGLAGSPAFYAALYATDTADWAYQQDKWEFEAALRRLDRAESILDIGCGGGAFLAKLGDRVQRRAGLETSPLGRQACERKGLQAFDETIVEHAKSHPQHYDAITAFQVLEHVSDPREFLQGCLDALAPGGTLILSVPNNDSFLSKCALLPLNSPPHHVTLWSRRSLEALPALFPLTLTWLEKEPLQDGNLGWYQSTMEDRYLPRSRLARAAYYKLGGDRLFRRYLQENRDTIDGHTILAAYRKLG